MRFTRGEKTVVALFLSLFATAALATTRAAQVLFAPGSAVILTGATAAAPGATSPGGLLVDTVNTLTNGYLAEMRNNGTSKFAVDFNGKEVLPCAATKTAGAAVCGSAALDTSGTVTIATTAVTANSVIFLNRSLAGGTAGTLYSAATADITAGTNFIIRSFSSGTTAAASDTSTIQWRILN